MPLDMIRQVETKLEGISGLESVFAFEEEALSHVMGDELAIIEIETAFAVWRAVAGSGFDAMALHAGGKTAVATAHGGLIALGASTLDVSAVQSALADLHCHAVPHQSPERLFQHSPGQEALLALAERLGRVEAARVFELLIGDTEYVLDVRRDGFGIVAEEGGAHRLRDQIFAAAEAGAAMEYTLGTEITREVVSRHELAALFGESEDGRWSFTGDWPVAVPAGASFADIIQAMDTQAALLAVGDMAVCAEFFDIEGRKVLTAHVQGQSGTQAWV